MLGDIVFECELSEFELANESDPLVFRKELIYEGSFSKGDQHFTVSKDLINHWVDTFGAFAFEGIDVPVPLGHTSDPTKTQAIMLGMETALNSKGRHALYGLMRFKDADAAKLAKTSQVSIYSPPKFKSSSGVEYPWPIRHVAITNYPVINGLEKFQALALSFDEAHEVELEDVFDGLELSDDSLLIGLDYDPLILGTNAMTLRELATLMGVPPTVTDAQQLVDQMAAIWQAKVAPPAAPPAAPAAPPAAGPPKPAVPPRPIAASFIEDRKTIRSMKIDGLVGKHITTAVATDLKAQYCGDEAITLSLSDDAPKDGFDAVIDALKKNTMPTIGEKTGGQTSRALRLSQDKDNSMTRAAARKAEKAAK